MEAQSLLCLSFRLLSSCFIRFLNPIFLYWSKQRIYCRFFWLIFLVTCIIYILVPPGEEQRKPYRQLCMLDSFPVFPAIACGSSNRVKAEVAPSSGGGCGCTKDALLDKLVEFPCICCLQMKQLFVVTNMYPCFSLLGWYWFWYGPYSLHQLLNLKR